LADQTAGRTRGGRHRRRAGQQTWENLGRALEAAENFVEEGGAIAVCCELSAPPGPAMQHLAGESSHEAALRHVAKKRPVDTLAAAQLVHALDRCKVYLFSRIDASVVEDLDMIPIDRAEELVRLARKHSSCILLSNAANVTVVDESKLTCGKSEGGTTDEHG